MEGRRREGWKEEEGERKLGRDGDRNKEEGGKGMEGRSKTQ